MRKFLCLSLILWSCTRGAVLGQTDKGDNREADKTAVTSVAGPGGSALDLVPFGYQFRAGRPAAQNPPETQWLDDGRKDVLAGVMWEEHRPIRQIEIGFISRAPDPSRLVLEVTTSTPTQKQDNRPTWWTRKYELFPGKATRSADGRRLVYQTDQQTIIERLGQYPEGFKYEADPHGLILVDKIRLRCPGVETPPQVVSFQARGIISTISQRLEIEWGFRAEQRSLSFDGRLEIYNGFVGAVKPLGGSQGVAMTSSNEWRSSAMASGRRGVEAEINYVADDQQEIRFRPSVDLPAGSSGLLVYHPNRTVVTVRTVAGSFSFAPRDLESGDPILVPSLGFFIARAGTGQMADSYTQSLAAKRLRTIRQQVRSMPEQSLAQALADQYSTQRPPYPRAEAESPMRIEVPDELVSAAWRTAFWHVKRRCIKEGDTYQIYIWPYKALLGQESWRIFTSLDWLGEHDIPRSGFDPWFKSQGRMTARGMFSDADGALNVSGWDLNHAQGHGSMLYAMAEHYRLSGDRAWLAGHLDHFKAACEWIIRQRRQWAVRAGPDTWSAGLMPPCEMGDYADWRSLYQTSVFFWRGLQQAAEAIAEVEPDTGARFRAEAEEFRLAIVKAVDRSILLAPVVRVGDGTCRRYIPPQPYLRGLCDQITNPFGGAHAGSLVMDSDCGAAALGLGVLAGDDARLDELLDVLEDTIYLDNWMVRRHISQRTSNPARTWFTFGGYYYQCGYSQSALAHLLRDDVPNYLRAMFNQYAADVDPDKGYQFREHPNRTGEGNGGDKTFEAGAFLERMRAMFVREEDDRLWLAQALPRAWLAQGQRVAVTNAPTHFGTVAYEITSRVQEGIITARVTMPSRRPPTWVILRFRHPQAAPMRHVEVNGKPWKDFDPAKEYIRLDGRQDTVTVSAGY